MIGSVRGGGNPARSTVGGTDEKRAVEMGGNAIVPLIDVVDGHRSYASCGCPAEE